MLTIQERVQTNHLSDEQKKNARHVIHKLIKDTLSRTIQLDDLPDMGPLREAIELLLNNYRESGAGVIANTIKSLSDDYPILLELSKKNKYEALDLIDLLNLPDQEWILENFFYEHAISVIYGPPGSYKSFVVLDWMCHLALGWSWQGRPVKQCRVIYLTGEGERGYKRRMRAWLHHFKADPLILRKYLAFTPLAVPLHNNVEVSEYIESLQDVIDTYSDGLPTFIVLDTLFQCATGQNINATETMTTLVSAAQRIKNETRAIHILIVHHTGKEEAKGMTGSIALKGSTDISYLIKADKDGLITIISDKIKDDEDITTYVQREKVVYGAGKRDNSCIILSAEKPEQEIKLTAYQEIIIDALPDNPPGLRFGEVSKQIEQREGKAMRSGTLSSNLKKLEEMKKVQKTTEGLYHKSLARVEGILDDEE